MTAAWAIEVNAAKAAPATKAWSFIGPPGAYLDQAPALKRQIEAGQRFRQATRLSASSAPTEAPQSTERRQPAQAEQGRGRRLTQRLHGAQACAARDS